MARTKKIDAPTLARILFGNSQDPFGEPSEDMPEVCILVEAFGMGFSEALDLWVKVQDEVRQEIESQE